MKIFEPIVLISWCPQCKKVLKEYHKDIVIQEIFEDGIRHTAVSVEKFKHTPFLMVRVVV